MSEYRIGLVHATMNPLQPIYEAFRRLAPDVRPLSFMDEGLMDELNRTGEVTPRMLERLLDLARRAEESGAQAILLTCSAFSPYVEQIGGQLGVPMQSADGAMLEAAGRRTSGRIAVLATLGSAGPTTARQLEQLAAVLGKQVQVEHAIVPGARDALARGDMAAHDDIVRRAIRERDGACDVIVLAQMSMAGAGRGVAVSAGTSVISSPDYGVKAIMQAAEGRI